MKQIYKLISVLVDGRRLELIHELSVSFTFNFEWCIPINQRPSKVRDGTSRMKIDEITLRMPNISYNLWNKVEASLSLIINMSWLTLSLFHKTNVQRHTYTHIHTHIPSLTLFCIYLVYTSQKSLPNCPHTEHLLWF